jgi:sugar phosphate isomerase/epimerase
MQTAIFTKVFGGRGLYDACSVAADVGYDAVELMGRAPHFGPETSDERARELRAHLDDLGIEVSSIASYTGGYVDQSDEACEAELADLERFCELADIVGCDLIRHGPDGPPEFRATEDDYERAATWMRRAADIAASYEKEIAVEVHALKLTETPATTREFIDRIDRDNVGAIHDGGNMYIVGTDFGHDSVAELGDRLRHVHVKDEIQVADDGPGVLEIERPDGTERFQPRLLDEGAVDHAPLFEALVDREYEGYVVAECAVSPHDTLTDRRIAECELAAMERLERAARSA